MDMQGRIAAPADSVNNAHNIHTSSQTFHMERCTQVYELLSSSGFTLHPLPVNRLWTFTLDFRPGKCGRHEFTIIQKIRPFINYEYSKSRGEGEICSVYGKSWTNSNAKV
jgi:hypothetical protein